MVGVLLLTIVTPFEMGAVHPWAYKSAELVAFGLAALWMAKLAFRPPIPHQPDYRNAIALAAPLAMFIAFIAFQLVPLPPSLIRVLSPGTYHLYQESLSGWPATAPYQAMFQMPPSATGMPVVLPTPKEVKEGREVPRAKAGVREAAWAPFATKAPRWRPLSIAPDLTREILLKFAGYAAVFFVVMLFPFGPSVRGEAEKRFCRNLLIAVLGTGLLVACVAILERVAWNGKVMWIFIPYDWGRANAELFDRARGPFVNPDHFAAYMNLVLPTALTGVLFPTFITNRNSAAFRVFCGAATFVIGIALLLSLSRAGWFGAVLGVATLMFLATFIPVEQRPPLLRLSWRLALPVAAVGLVLVLATSSMFVSEQDRREADLRLQETISQHQSLRFRADVWRDALPMVRDFPLFGSGIGAFQDLFPRYQSPPTPLNEVRQTHNDYLELLIGAGAIGFGLLAWFFVAVGVRLYRGLRALPPEVLPIAAAMLAAMAAISFQEFFDFNLQIPANAILFTILFALVMRLIATRRLEERDVQPDPVRTRYVAAVVSAAAALLAIVALRQGSVPYPYNLMQPRNPVEARELVLAHPASSLTHVWMVEAMGSGLDRGARAKELAAAAWLSPLDPYVLDLYAQSLVWLGREQDALTQITHSVFVSPDLSVHFYLQWRMIPYLLPDERAAVEKGFNEAVAHDFTGAIWSFGAYYGALKEFRNEARLFAGAAARDRTYWKGQLLLAAGEAWGQAGDLEKAEAALKQAAELNPTDPHAYEDLVKLVYAPRRDMKSAKATIDRAVASGVDPFDLDMALADAAQNAGDPDTLESALQAAVEARPSEFESSRRLAELYLSEKKFDEAASWMRKATAARPDNPWAFYELGLAEESSYNYFGAEKDLAHAVELSPDNKDFRQHLDEFRKKADVPAEPVSTNDSDPGAAPAPEQNSH